MTPKEPAESVRFVIDLGPVEVPHGVGRAIADGMRQVVTDALARMDAAPSALTVADATMLPPDLYGYGIDGGDVPGGPWPPPIRDLNPF